MQTTLWKAARKPQVSSSWLLWESRAAPQEEHNAGCVYCTHAQHLIIVALLSLMLSDPVGYFFSLGFCLQIPFLLATVLLWAEKSSCCVQNANNCLSYQSKQMETKVISIIRISLWYSKEAFWTLPERMGQAKSEVVPENYTNVMWHLLKAKSFC